MGLQAAAHQVGIDHPSCQESPGFACSTFIVLLSAYFIRVDIFFIGEIILGLEPSIKTCKGIRQ